MPEMYESLAGFYDRIQNINTPAWADYIQKIELKYSRRAGAGDGAEGRTLLLDLGCGTGDFCLEMLRRGYDPIGIDRSAAMLSVARDKLVGLDGPADRPACLFLQQDISRFQLYGTVDLIVCLLDTVNHLTREAQVRRFFKLCGAYLNPGGLLVFDLATARHLAQTLGERLFVFDEPDYTVIWQNHYNNRQQTSHSDLAIFSRREFGLYGRHDERIAEKYYDASQISCWAGAAGLDVAACLGELSMSRPGIRAERTFCVLRRPPAPSTVKRSTVARRAAPVSGRRAMDRRAAADSDRLEFGKADPAQKGKT